MKKYRFNPVNDGKDKTKEVRRFINLIPNGTREKPVDVYFHQDFPVLVNGMVWEKYKNVKVKVSELRKKDDRNYFYDFDLPELERGYKYQFLFSGVSNGGITLYDTKFRYLKDHNSEFVDELIEFDIIISDDHEYADIGEYGILRVENKKFVRFHFKPTIQFYTNVDTELKGYAKDRTHHDTARRKFWLFVNCEEVEAHYINAEMNNKRPNPKGGREDFPIFSKFREFEHFIEFDNCKKMYFTNIHGRDIYGDGIYTYEGCEDITVINGLIDRNGRQTLAPCGGKRLWFEGITGTASTRGYCDIEIPNTSALQVAEDIVVKKGKGKTWLNGFPIGGSGDVNRVLFEDIELDTKSRTSYMNGAGRRKRDNITFRRIVRTRSHGSDKSINAWYDAHNVFLEDCDTVVSADRSQQVVELHGDCKNIIIKGDTGENIKYLELNGVNPKEVHVYENQNELTAIDGEGNVIKLLEDSKLEDLKMPEEPNFKPYMGIEVPETPDEGGSEQVPGFPEEPPKEDQEKQEEVIEKPKVEKAWCKNKNIWIVGGIGLLILIGLLTLLI
ncbi:hypothetical protein ML462_14120 [Gramella lutea]|uniref:Uncharacterized protein n=1 Tax=Christiangramia lutea TaxID=1607951 RepID=A0A9X2ACQ6_9FLAO|nr:hypothetical protein [Christiangramia lutea]MCH4824308.1 hypothetical protein [Christiangramia lutea]